MKKIYIAGPDVFEKDSIQIGKKLDAIREKRISPNLDIYQR